MSIVKNMTKKGKELIKSIILKAFILAELLLILRLILKFLEANPRAFIVDTLYKITNIIIWPFEGIFPNLLFREGNELDIVAISGMLGYAIIVFLIFLVLRLKKEE